MTYVPGTWTCDVCSQPVDEDKMVTLRSEAGTLGRENKKQGCGWIGHYHFKCYKDEVKSAVHAVAHFEPEPGSVDDLGRIPVINDHELWNLREQHRAADGSPVELIEPELRAVLLQVGAYRYALPRAGITTLRQVARMTDDELLAIEGVGPKLLRLLRKATAAVE